MSRHLRFSARHRSFSATARAAMLLLAILQFVAPTWHVCDMGGGRCCNCHDAATVAWKPKCGGGPHCTCIRPRAATGATHAEVGADDDDCGKPFSGTCLAMVLMQMPWTRVQGFDLGFSTIGVPLGVRDIYSPPSLITAAQPLERGPPLSA